MSEPSKICYLPSF